MSQNEVERFLGRIITDADFRARAAHSLKSACYCEGITLSTEEMALLSSIDFSKFGLVAETLDDSIRRGQRGTGK
jgi:hypothetical protein